MSIQVQQVLIAMAVLLGISVPGMTFVLNTSGRETTTSIVHPDVNSQCQESLLQSIRKDLLDALHLPTEPRLPAGWLKRDQWPRLNTITHRTHERASGLTVTTSDCHSSTGFKCCQISSQISLKDLGWDNWMIYPESFTVVQCAPCNPLLEENNLRCPSLMLNTKNSSQAQIPHCQSNSQEWLPVMYMEEVGTVVIQSVQFTRTCGCASDAIPLPNVEG